MKILLEKIVEMEDKDFVYGKSVYDDGTSIPWVRHKPDASTGTVAYFDKNKNKWMRQGIY